MRASSPIISPSRLRESVFSSQAYWSSANEKLGGFIAGADALTMLVNYLVVGNLERRARKRKGDGGKINMAMNLNREGHCGIQIIREHDFVEAVLKTFRKFEIKKKPFVKAAFTY